jgi:ABC-type bacteriocin/lantibiotic exporter with double-glycine peptidase domain
VTKAVSRGDSGQDYSSRLAGNFNERTLLDLLLLLIIVLVILSIAGGAFVSPLVLLLLIVVLVLFMGPYRGRRAASRR